MKKWIGPVYLFAAFSLAGTSVVCARLVSGKIGTFTIAGASLFFAVLALVPFCWRSLIGTARSMKRWDWLSLFLQALCGIFLFRMFLLYGLERTSTAEAGILTGATPAITAILAYTILHEPASRSGLAGILCTVSGVLLVNGLLGQGSHFSIDHGLGNLLVLGAAGCEASFNILSRILAVKTTGEGRPSLNPWVQTTLVSIIAGGLCILPAAGEDAIERLAVLDAGGWLALVWYGVFVTGLAFICWYNGIQRCPASTAAAFTGMMPFTSLALSVILLGETAGFEQWVGGGLIILGMILIGVKPSGKVLQFLPREHFGEIR